MFKPKSKQQIPKILHFVWLGSLLDEAGRANVVNWKKTNPDYEANLWIDTSLFPRKPMKTKHVSDAEFKLALESYNTFEQEFKKLKKWAKENKIKLKDAHAISHAMPNKEFYFEETSGSDRNLAAASDILRLYLLLLFGGVYLDVKDVFPRFPLKLLVAINGFLCHMVGADIANNDIMASAPDNEIVRQLIIEIGNRYRNLHKDVRKTSAHRTPIYGGPDLFRGQDSRKMSTIEGSGPDLLGFILAKIINLPPIQELFDKYGLEYADEIEKLWRPFAFDDQFFETPLEQAKSWGTNLLESDFSKFSLYAKHALCRLYIDKLKQLSDSKMDPGLDEKLQLLSDISPILLGDLKTQFRNILGAEEKDEKYGSLLTDLEKTETLLNAHLQELSQLNPDNQKTEMLTFLYKLKEHGFSVLEDKAIFSDHKGKIEHP